HNVSSVLRVASVERGRDPREMLLVAFGGAGPMHVCEVAQELGIKHILVPANAGLFSSLGLLLAKPSRDYVQTVMVRLEAAAPRKLSKLLHEMDDQGIRALAEQGVPRRNVRIHTVFDLRYVGQGFELSIPVPRRKTIEESMLKMIRASFDKAHSSHYGYSDKDSPVELVNLRVTCTGEGLSARLRRPRGSETPRSKSMLGKRTVTFLSEKAPECPIYDRGLLSPGFGTRGPVIVEDYDSTLIVPPGWRFVIDSYGRSRINFS
ncbi:MAG TPA: hydantoinase/oxoprolinase family protein, partial [Candidatus Binatus sp.]|nr:hydantoinase/oxoprolinase family protein [Candidatus Binatus sp.]